MQERLRFQRIPSEEGPGANEPADAGEPPRAHDEPAPPSDLDAMGLDKHRRVGGGASGPSRTRIAVRFAVVLAILIAVVLGVRVAVDRLDRPPETNAAEAPWAQPDAPQRPPEPLQ